MTRQEFENRTGIETNEASFEDIHDVYMAAGDKVDKDTFCRAYKHKTDSIWYIMRQMAQIINAQSRRLKDYKDSKNKMSDFIMQEAEESSSDKLRLKAIEMLGEKEYLRRKINKGYCLWEADKELLDDILS